MEARKLKQATSTPEAFRVWQRMDPASVRVGGVIGSRIERTCRNNLLVLDWDGDFLAPFVAKTSAAGYYVGLGKTMEALIRLAYHTGASELGAQRERVVDVVIGAQSADGYLGAYEPAGRVRRVWDVHEIAYIIQALVLNHRFFGHAQSLAAACRGADYLIERLTVDALRAVGPEEPDALGVTLSTIGLDRAMLALHAATGERRYLDFCAQVQGVADWDAPIVEGRFSPYDGHAYAYLARCLAQLDLHGITGQARLLVPVRRAMAYLCSAGGLVISGTCGLHECWHSDQGGTGELGETCATAYLIRVLDSLLRMTGDAACGDMMERAIYNALFAAQSPDGRRLRYYVPLEGKREYWDRDTYCCPGNFRRVVAELPELIYYGGERDSVTVNLYTASRLTTMIGPGISLDLEQDTDYPASGLVRLRVDPGVPVGFALRMRVPGWCRTFEVRVNGAPVPVARKSGWAVVDREWRRGDAVEIAMTMLWRLVRGSGKQDGRAAVMRGPMLFALNSERQDPAVGEPGALTLDASRLRDSGSGGPRQGGDASVWRVGAVNGQGESVDLALAEFPDPGGEATYFRVSDTALCEEDELLQR